MEHDVDRYVALYTVMATHRGSSRPPGARPRTLSWELPREPAPSLAAGTPTTMAAPAPQAPQAPPLALPPAIDQLLRRGARFAASSLERLQDPVQVSRGPWLRVLAASVAAQTIPWTMSYSAYVLINTFGDGGHNEFSIPAFLVALGVAWILSALSVLVYENLVEALADSSTVSWNDLLRPRPHLRRVVANCTFMTAVFGLILLQAERGAGWDLDLRAFRLLGALWGMTTSFGLSTNTSLDGLLTSPAGAQRVSSERARMARAALLVVFILTCPVLGVAHALPLLWPLVHLPMAQAKRA